MNDHISLLFLGWEEGFMFFSDRAFPVSLILLQPTTRQKGRQQHSNQLQLSKLIYSLSRPHDHVVWARLLLCFLSFVVFGVLTY